MGNNKWIDYVKKYAKEHNIEIMEPVEFLAKYFA